MTSTPFWGPDFDALQAEDPEIAGVVLGELDRLRSGLQLIASENFTSPAVLAALGSTLSNKYAEGYPGRRYYGGCQVVDQAEEIGIARAKELFGADHANLQPHSGASANLAAYAAICQPGDTVLAMSLPHGGHLTHGSKVNFSGKWFNIGVLRRARGHRADRLRRGPRPGPRAPAEDDHLRRHGVPAADRLRRLPRASPTRSGPSSWSTRPTSSGWSPARRSRRPVPYADVVSFTTHKVLRGPRGGMIVCREDMAKAIDKAVFPFTQGGPLMHAVAAKAVALKEAMQPAYQAYARQVIANAQALAAGLAAEGMRPVSGGTDTHLALIDLRGVGVTGKRGRGPLRRRPDHAEQERDPVRPAAADDRLRHPGRHPGDHHPGHDRGRRQGDRGADRPRGARRRRRRPRSPQGVDALVQAHPAYARG